MVQIIVPLRVETPDPAALPRQAAGLVAVVFEDEMNLAIGDMPAHGFADLVDDVGHGLVENGVDGIEPQPVEMVFLEPIERIMDKKIAHRPAARPGRNRSRRPMACGVAR